MYNIVHGTIFPKIPDEASLRGGVIPRFHPSSIDMATQLADKGAKTRRAKRWFRISQKRAAHFQLFGVHVSDCAIRGYLSSIYASIFQYKLYDMSKLMSIAPLQQVRVSCRRSIVELDLK